MQLLVVDRGDRGLPRHGDLERERELLPLGQLERPADRDPVELADRVVVVASLHPGDQPEGDVLDLHVTATPDEVDLAGQHPTRLRAGLRQHRVDARAADSEAPSIFLKTTYLSCSEPSDMKREHTRTMINGPSGQTCPQPAGNESDVLS